jgi:large subunit ribosomal protein L25
METFELNADIRSDLGKGASRRLRHAKKVPAIMYGAGKDPQPLSLDHDELVHHAEHEAFYSHVLTLHVAGQGDESVVVKDMQRHPFKPSITHVDFLRVSASDKIRMQVPLHFLNEATCPGVKTQGGQVMHLSTEVEVSCLPKDLPEFIEVDMGAMSVGDSIHLSQLKLPAGVEIVELSHGEEHDLAVVSIHKARGASGEEAEEEGEGGEGE